MLRPDSGMASAGEPKVVPATLSFLRAILPPSGVYFAITFDANGKVPHHAYTSVESLAAGIEALNGRGLTVYHACASYKQAHVMDGWKKTFRKGDNVQALRAFWLDIDVDAANAAKYPDQPTALRDLVEFVRVCCLPVPTIVNSGTGLHCYWPLVESISPEEWEPVAAGLKRLTTERGLRADPTRTSDRTSILRPVGSANRKRGACLPVELVHTGAAIAFAEFAATIGGALGQPTTTSAAPVVLAANAQFEIPSVIRAPGPFSPIERRHVDEALRCIPADDYDTWFRIGAALKSSGDPSAFAIWDVWSQKSAKYQSEGMANKWQTISPDGGIGLGTLFQIAKVNGFVPVPPSDERLTDVGNSKRLVRLFGAVVRYVPKFNTWLVWDHARWLFDEDGHIERLAKLTAKSLYEEASSEANDERRRALAKHAASTESASRIQAMIRLACSESGVAIQPDGLDSDSWLLNVKNGTLNLRSGALRAPRELDYITKQANVAFDPLARCPNWERFVLEVMGGNVDLAAYLQRALGYVLTGSTTEQCMFVLHGYGANGKSTLLNTIRVLLGDYAMSCPAETLMVKREGSISNDIARLRGARFVAASETEDGHRLAESLVKQLTGCDAVTARFLHQEFFEFVPNFKIFLAANHKPIIQNNDHGIWRRIHLIPFEVTFSEAERDLHLSNKLLAELPGILNWMLAGLFDYQRDGLKLPAAARSATEQYRSEMDVIGQWIDERCVRQPDVATGASALFQNYDLWARMNGRRSISSTRFGQKLSEQGFTKFKSNVVAYRGLALKPPQAVSP